MYARIRAFPFGLRILVACLRHVEREDASGITQARSSQRLKLADRRVE